jgi:hypothetical protein
MQDQDKTKVAEDKLAQTFGTTIALWHKLKRFNEIASGGLPSGVKEQIVIESATMRYLVETGDLAQYLYDPNDVKFFLNHCDSPEMHQKTLETNQSIIDAACIVFAHGILEDCVYEYLTTTAIASPERWECYVKRKKVELVTFKEVSFEQIRNDKIEKLLGSDVKRESLIDKLDRLHRITPPVEDTKKKKVSYDRERLVKFDRARQDIVHGNDWSSYSFNFAQEWDYWNVLNFYFAHLVCVNTGLKISTKRMGHYWMNQSAKK